jgi:hypothetical protein
MRRLAILAICLGAFAFSLGCDSGSKSTLPEGKDPPPKRDGVKQKK